MTPALWLCLLIGAGSGPLEVGMAAVDITPPLTEDRPVWLAGQENGRRATGVHDPLSARALVLRDARGGDLVALVSLDVIGVQFPTVERIRRAFPAYRHVLVASTPNHEGPDVVGLWGPAGKTGLDPAYLDQ